MGLQKWYKMYSCLLNSRLASLDPLGTRNRENRIRGIELYAVTRDYGAVLQPEPCQH